MVSQQTGIPTTTALNDAPPALRVRAGQPPLSHALRASRATTTTILQPMLLLLPYHAARASTASQARRSRSAIQSLSCPDPFPALRARTTPRPVPLLRLRASRASPRLATTALCLPSLNLATRALKVSLARVALHLPSHAPSAQSVTCRAAWRTSKAFNSLERPRASRAPTSTSPPGPIAAGLGPVTATFPLPTATATFLPFASVSEVLASLPKQRCALQTRNPLLRETNAYVRRAPLVFRLSRVASASLVRKCACILHPASFFQADRHAQASPAPRAQHALATIVNLRNVPLARTLMLAHRPAPHARLPPALIANKARHPLRASRALQAPSVLVIRACPTHARRERTPRSARARPPCAQCAPRTTTALRTVVKLVPPAEKIVPLPPVLRAHTTPLVAPRTKQTASPAPQVTTASQERHPWHALWARTLQRARA